MQAWPLRWTIEFVISPWPTAPWKSLQGIVRRYRSWILDEPTAVLDTTEVDDLHAAERKMPQGLSIIIISQPQEVLAISHRVGAAPW
jgi:hypothetical protein